MKLAWSINTRSWSRRSRGTLSSFSHHSQVFFLNEMTSHLWPLLLLKTHLAFYTRLSVGLFFVSPCPQACLLIIASFRIPVPPEQFVLEFYPTACAHADNDLLRCCLQSRKEPFNQPPSERGDQSGSVSIGQIQTPTPPPPPPPSPLFSGDTDPRQTNKSESAGRIPKTSIPVTVTTV